MYVYIEKYLQLSTRHILSFVANERNPQTPSRAPIPLVKAQRDTGTAPFPSHFTCRECAHVVQSLAGY